MDEQLIISYDMIDDQELCEETEQHAERTEFFAIKAANKIDYI